MESDKDFFLPVVTVSNTNLKYTFIWIRHGEKQYCNNKGPSGSYQHDPPLLKVKEIIERGKHLMDLYGVPKKCISSPYLRCRQTANFLLGDEQVGIFIDTNISEFLGYQKRGTYPDVEPTTIECSKGSIGGPLPMCGEYRKELNDRIRRHLDILDKGNNPCNLEPGVYWIVTHGIIIEDLFQHLLEKGHSANIKHINSVNILDALILDNNEIKMNLK